jgi:hypothetical protein
MKTLTINYLSHERLDSQKYWNITSHFINKIKFKDRIKVNLLLSHDNNFEDYLDPNIEVEKFICNSYMEKIIITSKSKTNFSMKLDEDVFFSNFVFDKFIELSLNPNANGIYWPIISINTAMTDLFIEKFIKEPEIVNNIHKSFLKVKFPRNLWKQKNAYLKLNFLTLFAKEWNSQKFNIQVNKTNSVYKGIHPIRLSYKSEILLNQYVIANLSRVFDDNNFKLVEFKDIYMTSNIYMMKTEHFRKYLKYEPYDIFDEVQLNDYIVNERIQNFYIDNAYAVHTMFSTVKGHNKLLNNNINRREAELEELYFVNKVNEYLNI